MKKIQFPNVEVSMKRVFALAILLVALAPASPAGAPPAADQQAAAQEENALPVRAIALASLFTATESVAEVTGSGMTVVRDHSNNVMVARVAADGSLVTACVDSEKAARGFLKVREIAGEVSRAK